jgi:hypothetical protein
VANADIKLQPNKHRIDLIKLTEQEGQMMMRIYYHDGRDEFIPLGYGNWCYGNLMGEPPYSIMPKGRFNGLRHNFVTGAAYAWTTPTILTIQVHYVNFVSATTLTFDTERATVTITDNFDPTHPEVITCATVKQ